MHLIGWRKISEGCMISWHVLSIFFWRTFFEDWLFPVAMASSFTKHLSIMINLFSIFPNASSWIRFQHILMKFPSFPQLWQVLFPCHGLLFDRYHFYLLFSCRKHVLYHFHVYFPVCYHFIFNIFHLLHPYLPRNMWVLLIFISQFEVLVTLDVGIFGCEDVFKFFILLQ